MSHTKNYFFKAILVALGIIAITLVATPTTHAASYAYVDTNGEVKSVTATDWMTAIKTAIGISARSGVLLLSTAADMMIVK